MFYCNQTTEQTAILIFLPSKLAIPTNWSKNLKIRSRFENNGTFTYFWIAHNIPNKYIYLFKKTTYLLHNKINGRC